MRTDNNPLTYVHTSARVNATGHRWLAALATYDFTIQYRPGRQNVDADLLSRQYASETQRDWIIIPPSGIKALCKWAHATENSGITPRLVDQLGTPPEVVPEVYACPGSLRGSTLDQLTPQEIKIAQDLDPTISPVKAAIEAGKVPVPTKHDPPDVALICREANKLQLRDGLLYRVKQTVTGEEVKQLVLPERFRNMVLRSLHDECGHLGIERTSELLKDRFYWPHMANEVEQYVNSIPHRSAALNQITSTGPLDLVCIDFLQIEPDIKGITNVLVVTDHYTRYAQAFPTRDQKAMTVAKVLWEKYFVHYGLPAWIHSDQERDFES